MSWHAEGVKFLRRPTDDALDAFLKSVSEETLSYPEVGASLGMRPAGYRHDEVSRELGRGPDVYGRAVEGLQRWQAHRGSGIRVRPADPPIAEGTTIAMALPLAGTHVLAACRIVRVIDRPDHFGFAYGTLFSHPEQGEELFVVATVDDTVTFHISSFSRPGDVLTHLGSPFARRIQRRTTARYLDGLAAYVRDPT